jgi:uncharacterized membrane protein YhaH (DUF805 family)
MDWGSYFLSFEGRINRAKMWLFFPIVIAAYVAFGIILNLALGVSLFALLLRLARDPISLFTGSGAGLPSIAIFCVFYLFTLFISLAVSAKRLHDRGKGAAWLLLFIILPRVLGIVGAALMPRDSAAFSSPADSIVRTISAVISIWAFIELYCLRGTAGDNRYGPDPLGSPQDVF